MRVMWYERVFENVKNIMDIVRFFVTEGRIINWQDWKSYQCYSVLPELKYDKIPDNAGICEPCQNYLIKQNPCSKVL